MFERLHASSDTFDYVLNDVMQPPEVRINVLLGLDMKTFAGTGYNVHQSEVLWFGWLQDERFPQWYTNKVEIHVLVRIQTLSSVQ